jgi:hypothetical protein
LFKVPYIDSPQQQLEMESLEDSQIVKLLETLSLKGPYTFWDLASGGNNKLKVIETAASKVVLKQYFRHQDDPRDRFATEYSMLRFMWNNRLRCIPKPLAGDAEKGLAIYSYIEGRTPKVGDVDGNAIGQAIDFFRALNSLRSVRGAHSLLAASEACFSEANHLELVDRRVSALTTLKGVVGDFVMLELIPKWELIKVGDVFSDGLLAVEKRCLSPSDFGFHNSILDENGRYYFLDFEYSGWDDPAKTVCDFICQPVSPVPEAYFERFAAAVADAVGDTDCPARSRRLMPVYTIKWCCILLGRFLPVGMARRAFAGGNDETEKEFIGRQLAMARNLLDRI